MSILVGVLLWFLLVKGSLPGIDSSGSASGTLSTQGLSDKDLKEIADLQTQLALEKARADQVRETLRARALEQELKLEKQRSTQSTANNSADSASLSNSEIATQTQRIKEMIEAQTRGTEENIRLAASLKQKEAEIETVKGQNVALAQRIHQLDSSTGKLLATLNQNSTGNISADDRDYLAALSDVNEAYTYLSEEKRSQIVEVKAKGTDLINRLDIADTAGGDAITRQLRAQVEDLMDSSRDKPKQEEMNLVVNVKPAAGRSAATSLQDQIDLLFQSRDNRKAERQFKRDSEYLASLVPVERERSNETRWVTVKRGDTLWDIAQRAYNDGWLYPKIYAANPQVLTNPNLIHTGQRLRVPL